MFIAECPVCGEQESYYDKAEIKAEGWVCYPPAHSVSGSWEDVCPACLTEYRAQVRRKEANPPTRAKQAADLFKPV